MPTRREPRKGSLQFWPRKRAKKFLPSVNWKDIPNSPKNIKGFICYKAGMISAYVKDETPNSMTKGKKIVVPATILECPPMKIFSVRFYKNGKVAKEILAESLDKELKRKVKIPKKKVKFEDALKEIKDYDNVKIIVYSLVKNTNIKKTPDLCEIGLSGSLEDKLNLVKSKINKEITLFDVLEKGQLVDFRGITKGKGFQGPVKRFGIGLKQHKSEKGRRKPGSLGPWHPAYVTFRVPRAGQLGMFTRIVYNNKIIDLGKVKENSKLRNIKNFGDIKTDYIIVTGSVQGPAKRVLLATYSLRQSKKQLKKVYEFLEVK